MVPLNQPEASVSIVIPAYNAERTIGQAVSCAKGQRGLPAPPEAIVVDDGSSDRTAEIVEALGVRCIRRPNAGPAAARNAGFRNSHGDYVLFTDSDCLPDSHWAARMIQAFRQPQVGAAGGSYTMANEGLIASGIHWEIISRHRRFARYVRALGSYNLAVRRDVMEAVGGFDETFPAASGEDNDLSYRISAAGYKLRWVADATVGHFHTQRLGKYLREQYRHGFWRAKLYRRHAGLMSGDDYTLAKDILEQPLVLAFVASLSVCWLRWPLFISAGLLAVLGGIQIPMTVRMVPLSGKFSVAWHAGAMFLRAFARTAGILLGMVLGIVDTPARRSVKG